MRRITSTELTREACARRALDALWRSENSPSPKAAARAWDEARYWRSLALVAGRPGYTRPNP